MVTTMEDFIREKIKDKPVNKKKIFIKVGVSALCGIVFAVTASIVFCILMPHFPEKDDNEQIMGTENEAYMEPIQQDSQNTQDGTEDTQTVIPQTLTLDDYQSIQNELYKTGASASRSIVGITSVVDSTDIFNNSYETEGQGVGVIIKDNGKQLLILTEKNIVDGADKLSVTFANDIVVDAVAVKYDSNTGIAIVSVDKSLIDESTMAAVSIAKIGNSNIMSRGALVIALETNYSIMTGCITSTSNTVSAQDNKFSVFTTDIVSSELQSGILINTSGDVIGLVLKGFNAADVSNTLTAVAISDIEPIIDMLEEGNNIPYIGILGTTVTEKIANRYNIPKGVYIKEVTMDSPAFQAGLQNGDVITELNNTKVTSIENYHTELLSLKPDETYDVTVKRKGSNGYTELTCQVKISVMD